MLTLLLHFPPCFAAFIILHVVLTQWLGGALGKSLTIAEWVVLRALLIFASLTFGAASVAGVRFAVLAIIVWSVIDDVLCLVVGALQATREREP